MFGSHARFELLTAGIYNVPSSASGLMSLVLRDMGPWDQHPTITNDAEHVIASLVGSGKLKEGQRVFYFDSEGHLDELLIENGTFVGFAPGPR